MDFKRAISCSIFVFVSSASAFALTPVATADQVDCKIVLTRVFRSGSGSQVIKRAETLNFSFTAGSLSQSESFNIHKLSVSVNSVSSESSIQVKVVDTLMSTEVLVTELALTPGGSFANKEFKFSDESDMYDPARISCKSTLVPHETKPAVSNTIEKSLNVAPADSTRVSQPKTSAGQVQE